MKGRKPIDKNNLTKKVSITLTESEIIKICKLSKKILGVENKSGMIRYWINKHS